MLQLYILGTQYADQDIQLADVTVGDVCADVLTSSSSGSNSRLNKQVKR